MLSGRRLDFIQWLHTGVYENFQIEGTHIDADILSKTIGAPRFGNAVMEVHLGYYAISQIRPRLDREISADLSEL